MIVSAEIVALIAAAVAVFSAVLAVRAAALVARTVLAGPVNASAPAARAVSVRLKEGHTRRDLTADTRDYAFLVSVTNPTAADHRLAGATLRVTYRTRANFLGAVDLPSDAAIEVRAGESADATLRFSTSNVIPRHCRIDAYALLFLDEAGNRVAVDASLPAVLQADTDGAGPSSWGWD